MKQPKKLFLFLFLLILFFGILFFVMEFRSTHEKSSVWKYVEANELELENIARKLIEANDTGPLSYNNWKVSYWENADVVQFLVSEIGFGGSSACQGFYYSPTDQIVGFQGAYLDFIKEDDLWKWHEKNGDNFASVEKIRAHWYWFEMHF